MYDVLDFYIVERDDVDLNTPGAEAQIAADPLLRAELGEQVRDLAELAATADRPGERAALIQQLRDLARAEAPCLRNLQEE